MRIRHLASPAFALALPFLFTAALTGAEPEAKPADEKPACCREAQGAGAHCDRKGDGQATKACCAGHEKSGMAGSCCCEDHCDRHSAPEKKEAPPKR